MTRWSSFLVTFARPLDQLLKISGLLQSVERRVPNPARPMAAKDTKVARSISRIFQFPLFVFLTLSWVPDSFFVAASSFMEPILVKREFAWLAISPDGFILVLVKSAAKQRASGCMIPRCLCLFVYGVRYSLGRIPEILFFPRNPRLTNECRLGDDARSSCYRI